jgi:pyruvate/2-oxoglutarate dehydrogenase complex dihydrolipoamide acyltransferase (E2) component
MSPMHGLLDLDVTEADHILARSEPPLSFTAFVVASVARATAAHPEVHAYRNWRGQVVSHRMSTSTRSSRSRRRRACSRWLT